MKNGESEIFQWCIMMMSTTKHKISHEWSIDAFKEERTQSMKRFTLEQLVEKCRKKQIDCDSSMH